LTGTGTLVIRADANAAIGAGHVMRCLALAQAWQDAGGVAVFAAAHVPAPLEKRLAAENIETVYLRSVPGTEDDARELATLAEQTEAVWVVLDGQCFGAKYIEMIAQKPIRVMWVDDFGSEDPNPAELILNQNLGAATRDYPWCENRRRLLLGTEHVLIRREFRNATVERNADAPTSVLLTFGGSDPENLTERVLHALSEGFEDFAITAVASSENPRLAEVRRLACSMHVKLMLDVNDMSDLMTRSDLAVIIGGGTLWELLFSGCAVLSYSRNSRQAQVVATLAESGAAIDLGPLAACSASRLREEIRHLGTASAKRKQMQAAGRQIVDGNGVLRVLRAMNGE
jgi:UDP-2,4-diacetamido-2,4,6-trideoxy-beta-L-altropyranose hydrolase